jgi:prepilin-type N-terminal cleavage/methylation domain-containing protein
MKSKRHQTGFTLIEMAVTMMIIMILAGLAASSIVRSQPRYKVRGDTWTIYQAMTKAKFLSINGSRPFGIMFYHVDVNKPDYFFVFQDWDADGVYDDTDGNLLVQCNPATTAGCTEDPIQGAIEPLNASNYFKFAFGAPMNTAGSRAFVTFSPLGNVIQTLGPGDGTAVYIQSYLEFDRSTHTSYRGGVKVDPASGNASRTSIQPWPTTAMP